MVNFTKAVDARWSDYDQVVGECQLANFGVIFLDQYGLPIDNEYEQDEAYFNYMSENNGLK